jgi:hypothetical protein
MEQYSKSKTSCIEINCNIRASYGYPGGKPLFCSKNRHMKPGMINLTCKKCEKCDLQPAYNFDGEKSGRFCKQHKEDGMVLVKGKKCENVQCTKKAAFNFESEAKAKFCKDHIEKDMVNIKSRKCEKCRKKPSYNFRGEKLSRFCNDHKIENMINILITTCQKCDKIPCFNFEGEKRGINCFIHKEANMIDVVNHRCKTIRCETRGSKNKYKGYCLRCFIHLFPDEKVCRNYKTKEKHVSDFIKKNNPDTKIITDKMIENGCSRRRPDIMIDLQTHVIIVEIDENQHESYDSSCENKRIMEISQDLGHPNIVFIRFNPDSYFINEKKIKSCWKNNRFGIYVVYEHKEWDKRLKFLQDKIKFWKENIPDKHITIEKLYYDQ